MKPIRIVHCAIFSEYKDGANFFSMDRKISHGLHQNGHFVYDFSYRDWERSLRFFKIKNSGLNKMQKKLLNICKNINPDLLLLSKAEKISDATLDKIREICPDIKIAKWFVDHISTEKPRFFKSLNHVDTFFHANAKDLRDLSKIYKNTTFSFFPNISDDAFEKKFDFEKEYDVIYIARDYKEDVRCKFATLLKDFCDKNGIKLKMFASLGNSQVFGDDFAKEIGKSKIAINFNRDDYIDRINEEKILGASDRMAQFLGCGVCTFSPRIKGFDSLFNEDEIVYFDSFDDCCEKILKILNSKRYVQISLNGWQKSLEITNCARVTKFMLDVIFKNKMQKYEWDDFIFKNGENVW